MNTARLRKVGGSVMLAVPPAMLDQLGMSADKVVGLEVVDGALVVSPVRRKYRLDELLDESEPVGALTDEDRLFLDSEPVGREEV